MVVTSCSSCRQEEKAAVNHRTGLLLFFFVFELCPQAGARKVLAGCLRGRTKS